MVCVYIVFWIYSQKSLKSESFLFIQFSGI